MHRLSRSHQSHRPFPSRRTWQLGSNAKVPRFSVLATKAPLIRQHVPQCGFQTAVSVSRESTMGHQMCAVENTLARPAATNSARAFTTTLIQVASEPEKSFEQQ